MVWESSRNVRWSFGVHPVPGYAFPFHILPPHVALGHRVRGTDSPTSSGEPRMRQRGTLEGHLFEEEMDGSSALGP